MVSVRSDCKVEEDAWAFRCLLLRTFCCFLPDTQQLQTIGMCCEEAWVAMDRHAVSQIAASLRCSSLYRLSCSVVRCDNEPQHFELHILSQQKAVAEAQT